MLLVTLNLRIIHLATNQTFGIEDSVFRVRVEGVLCGVTDTARINASLKSSPTADRRKQRLTVVLRRRRIPMKE